MPDTLIDKLRAVADYDTHESEGKTVAIEQIEEIIKEHQASEIRLNDDELELAALAVENAKRYTPITLDDFRYMGTQKETTMEADFHQSYHTARAVLKATKRESITHWKPTNTMPIDRKILAYGKDLYSDNYEMHTTFWNDGHWANFTSHFPPLGWIDLPAINSIEGGSK